MEHGSHRRQHAAEWAHSPPVGTQRRAVAMKFSLQQGCEPQTLNGGLRGHLCSTQPRTFFSSWEPKVFPQENNFLRCWDNVPLNPATRKWGTSAWRGSNPHLPWKLPTAKLQGVPGELVPHPSFDDSPACSTVKDTRSRREGELLKPRSRHLFHLFSPLTAVPNDTVVSPLEKDAVWTTESLFSPLVNFIVLCIQFTYRLISLLTLSVHLLDFLPFFRCQFSLLFAALSPHEKSSSFASAAWVAVERK